MARTNSNAVVATDLPEAWRDAYERDRSNSADYADPAPERRAARALTAFIAGGLAFLAFPGTVLGVWNLIEIASHHSAGGASTAWIQAHGQAQVLGWVGSFILGISLYALPKFRGWTLKKFGAVWTVWALWTAGVAWRWWVGVRPVEWRVGLVASALLELAAYALAQRILLFPPSEKPKKSGRRAPSDLGSWLGIVGFAGLGLALAVNLAIAIYVSLTAGLPLYPARLDHLLLIAELWGFVVPLAWGYSTRFITIFLGLAPPDHRAARWLLPALVLIVLSAFTFRFWIADILALLTALAAVYALRIFHPPARPAKLLYIYRRYPLFIRISYGWLVAAATLAVIAEAFPRIIGLGGASRHALTVGFIATLIFALAPRMLPAFLGGRELYSPRLMAASLWLLTGGCLLRVSCEAVAYTSSPGSAVWAILPVSAFIELSAVLVFAANMALTLRQSPPAWLEPDSVSAELPLYWFVTSFPRTRALLIDAGLRTLAQVKDLPRSLSLRDAAAADGVEIQKLLQVMNEFFSRRQPRLRGKETPANS
jgi:uncharacterized protein involved in response to NO